MWSPAAFGYKYPRAFSFLRSPTKAPTDTGPTWIHRVRMEGGMLISAETMRGYKLEANDGEVGKTTDLYFDDDTWTVRYVVVQTGNWLGDHRVLITPRRVDRVARDHKIIETNLTRAEVKASPPADSDKPVSECMEIIFRPTYFAPPPYELERCDENADVHLRSTKEVDGYKVAASDGDIGHVVDFIVDDTDWVIRYLVVDTRDLWPGKHVLVSPEWVEEVDWNTHRVSVSVRRAAIQYAPEFSSGSPVTREYEEALCRFYNLEGYWDRPCDED